MSSEHASLTRQMLTLSDQILAWAWWSAATARPQWRITRQYADAARLEMIRRITDGWTRTYSGSRPRTIVVVVQPLTSIGSAEGDRWWRVGFDDQVEAAGLETWADAHTELTGLLREHAANLRSWSPPHDCDDIPCPTFQDDCPWLRAGGFELLAEELAEAAPDQPWEGRNDGGTYWIRPDDPAGSA